MRKGFTLVEVIVVLVIVALVASISVPSIIQYRKIYEQRNRDNIARSIFVAASNSITQKSTGGVLQGVQYEGKVQLNNLTSDKSEYYVDEISYNQGNIAYLSLNAGEEENGELYNLIEPYILDKTVLSYAILVEYNVITGRVLSAFYSDKVDSFGYGEGNYTDISDRSINTRRAKQIGYYGVKTTGVPFEARTIGNLTISLIDYTDPSQYGYGLLTAELRLPNIDLSDVILDFYILTDNDQTKFLTVFGETGVGISLNLVSTDLMYAFNNPMGENNDVLYIKQQNDENILVVVLDSIFSGFGIDRYTDYLGDISIKVVAKTGTSEKNVFSGSEHTHFDSVNQSTYNSSSIRHLNNVKYMSGSVFNQISDIYAYDYSATNTPAKVFSPISSFTGTYNGFNWKIISLNVKSDSAGLFQINNGTIKNVILSKPDIKGVFYSGGIAAINNGNIIDCTVGTVESDASILGEISTSGSNSNVGGVTGINNGTVDNCVNAVAVRNTNTEQNTYAGGIAGINKSLIIRSYNGGSIFSSGFTGGVTGGNLSASLIENSYNNGRVNIERGKIDSVGNNDYTSTDYVPTVYKRGYAIGGVAGGIVGNNIGIIRNSYSTNYVGNKNGGLFGQGYGIIENSYYLANEYNISQIYNNVELGLSEINLLSKNILDKPNLTIGRFNYIYPYVVDNVHDIPWEKVTAFSPEKVKGRIWLENKNINELHFLSYLAHTGNYVVEIKIDFESAINTDISFRLSKQDFDNFFNYKSPEDAIKGQFKINVGGYSFPIYTVSNDEYVNDNTEFCIMLSYVENGVIKNIMPDDYFFCSMSIYEKDILKPLYYETTEIEHTLYANSNVTREMGVSDTWLIKNTRHLLNIKRNAGNKFSQTGNFTIQDYKAEHFMLSNNIADNFSGIYNGNNYFIQYLQIKKASGNAGMFGINSGIVRDLKLIGPSMSGYNNVGAICGENTGTIENIIIKNKEIVKGGIDADVYLNGHVVYIDIAHPSNTKRSSGMSSLPELWVKPEAIYPSNVIQYLTFSGNPGNLIDEVYYIFYTSTVKENRWVHLDLLNKDRIPLLRKEFNNKNKFDSETCLMAPDETWLYRLDNVYSEFRWQKVSNTYYLIETGKRYYSNGTVVVADNVSLPLIVSSNGNSGGIAGTNTGSIVGCTNDGVSVKGKINSGGIVGRNTNGSILNCTNKADVREYDNSTQSVGGIIGRTEGGNISNCLNTDYSVKGIVNVGGIVGYCKDAIVNNVENNADIVGMGNYVGGLFGYADNVTAEGRVVNNRSGSFAIVGLNYVGGIAGYFNNCRVGVSSTVLNGISSNGSVRGNNNVGGIAGYLANCTLGNVSYLYRQVINYSYNIEKGERVGTIIGHLDNSLSNSYIYNCYNTGNVANMVANPANNVWPANSEQQPIVGYADRISDLNNYIFKRD